MFFQRDAISNQVDYKLLLYIIIVCITLIYIIMYTGCTPSEFRKTYGYRL